MKQFWKKYSAVICNNLLVFSLAMFSRFAMGLRWYCVYCIVDIVYEWIFIGINFLVIRRISFVKDTIENNTKLKDILYVSFGKYLRNFIITLIVLALPQLLYMLGETIWK